MASHTPGPWEVKEHRLPDGYRDYEITSSKGSIGLLFEKSDALLAAAVPELYEALRDLVACAETYDEFNDPNHDYYVAMHRASMALRQVEGRVG